MKSEAGTILFHRLEQIESGELIAVAYKVVLALGFGLNRTNAERLVPYLIVGSILWVLVLLSGAYHHCGRAPGLNDPAHPDPRPA
jgi:Na+/H+ antiporter NhaA